MKKLIIYFLLTSLKLQSQINLVYNPSFETYTSCPPDVSYMFYSNGWSYALNTPDYYNACSTGNDVSIPQNRFGNQLAAKGAAYAGSYVYSPQWNNVDYREYFKTKLSSDLVTGTKYYLSMKVALAEMWSFVYQKPMYLPCNKMGMKFSTKPVVATNNTITLALMNNQAHLYSQAIVSDTTNWTTIQGSFIADSAYSYLLIGNFFDNAHTDTLRRQDAGIVSYYYVDDIIVSTDSTIIDYTLGMAESSYSNKLMLYPNPAKDKLNMVFESTQAKQKNKALFYNLLGELIYEKPITETNTEIDISFLKRGLYYVKVQNAVAKVLVE